LVGPSGRGGKDCTHCAVVKCETAQLGRDAEIRQAMSDRGIGLMRADAGLRSGTVAGWRAVFPLGRIDRFCGSFQRQGSSADLQ
jgi:hypothetical protein